uniref:Uncharacterized protein n=1 Tax=Leersia perrieri TaxID=77586 RepID=A0A0D9W169_9ORYZ
MASDESFKRPGTIPFKWELQPGVPKQQPHHGGDTSSSPAPAPASLLLLPPRLLALPNTSGANILASTPSSSHRRSLSARFTASLVLPFTRQRRGVRPSKDEADDIAFTVLYGDKII